jgi:hypothetical protein
MGQTGSKGHATEQLSLACVTCNKPALTFESFVSAGPIHELAATQVSEMCAFLAACEPIQCQWCLNESRGKEAKEVKALEKETRRNEALIRKESLKGERLDNERRKSLLKRVSSFVEGDGVRRTSSGNRVSFNPDVTIHRQPSMSSIMPEPEHLSVIPNSAQAYYQAAATAPPVAVAAAAPFSAPAPPPPPNRSTSAATVPMISGPFARNDPSTMSRSISTSPPIPRPTATPPVPERSAPPPPPPDDIPHNPSYEPYEGSSQPPQQIDPDPYQTQFPVVPVNNSYQTRDEPQSYPPADPVPQSFAEFDPPADYPAQPPPNSYPQPPPNMYPPQGFEAPQVERTESTLERLRRENREAEEHLISLKRQATQQEREHRARRKMETNLAKKRAEAARQQAEMERRATMRESEPPPRDMSNPGPPPRAREAYDTLVY